MLICKPFVIDHTLLKDMCFKECFTFGENLIVISFKDVVENIRHVLFVQGWALVK
jgi:hypothetical protein